MWSFTVFEYAKNHRRTPKRKNMYDGRSVSFIMQGLPNLQIGWTPRFNNSLRVEIIVIEPLLSSGQPNDVFAEVDAVIMDGAVSIQSAYAILSSFSGSIISGLRYNSRV